MPPTSIASAEQRMQGCPCPASLPGLADPSIYQGSSASGV